MPIDLNKLRLNKTYLIVDPQATVESVYAMIKTQPRAERAFLYILTPLNNGRWFVARWIEIEELAHLVAPNQVRSSKLRDLAGLDTPLAIPLSGRYAKLAALSLPELQALFDPVESVDKDSTSTQEARDLRDQHPARRLVVTAGDQVIGLLTNETLAADALGDDVFAAKDRNAGSILGIAQDAPSTASSPVVKGVDTSRLTEVMSANDKEAEEIAKPETEEKRVFNHWMEQLNPDGTSSVLDNTTPLKAKTVYELKINLASPRSTAFEQTGVEALSTLESTLPDEVTLLEILIVLDSEDVIIYGSKEQTLTVERHGFSKNTVTFTIEPKRNSDCRIDAAFFYEGRCFQVIEYSLQVGGRKSGKQVLFAKEARGRTIESALSKKGQGQAYSLVIVKRENGYQFILTGAGVTRAFVPLTTTGIAQLVSDARNDLLEIVNTDHDNDKVYQSEQTFIPPEVHAATLTKLARRGKLLFQRLFSGTQGGADMADILSQISKAKQLHIEVIAEQFIFPWALLYDGDIKTVDPYAFWGFKHVIEYIPEFSLRSPRSFDLDLANIKKNERLAMAFVANTKIDDQLQAAMPPYPKVIEPQMAFFGDLATIALERITTTKEFLALLQNPNAPPLIYLNCHAVSRAPDEEGGVYKSALELSDGTINIDDLDLDAPVLANGGLLNGPLVFLNACQSAELTPYIYAGFVPAMLERGARGVIGTEVNTPTLFAAEFAQEFIKRFTGGNIALGDLLLTMRREYLEKKNNVMGLVYALYSNGALMINRS